MKYWKPIVELALAGLLVIGIAGGTVYAVSTTVDEAVAMDAERRARGWAEFMISTMPDLEKLVATGYANPAQMFQIKEMADIGSVFRFKLFNGAGDLVLISDEAHKTLEQGATLDHSGSAAKVLSTGIPEISLHDGREEINRPPTYAEAYVAVPDLDGNIIGVVEVYLDQTELSALFHDMFRTLSALLAGAFALTFGGVYTAFLIKNRQAARSREQADFLAQYDPTTRLLNRNGFAEAASAVIDSNDAHRAVMTVFVGVDGFKAINDTHGLKTGDAILCHIGEVILRLVEESDVAGRVGGDEFVVVGIRESLADVEAFVQKLQIAVSQPVKTEGKTVRGLVSIGVHYGTDKLALDVRRKKADLAHYQAKLEGGNCYRVFSNALEEHLVERRHLEMSISSGLEEDRFFLVYQPLLHQESGVCAGFEALLRLRHTDGQVISPTEFIPIAESSGQINEIGAWVLERAVRTALLWPESMFVAVNLSARQFESGELVDAVRKLLATTGFPASRLELEVTESLFIHDAEGVGKQLAQLRALGVSVAMDDFGTGYSSLGYLWQFGFDKLKIDRSFISGIGQDFAKAREIIDTIVTLGHRLEMKVTAEGIENPVQAALLKELSCDQLQGFFYGRPMPETELASFILDHRQAKPPTRIRAAKSIANRA